MKPVVVVQETFTPDRAAKVLAQYNPKNRSLRRRTVKAFAEDMSNRVFNGLNGETVKFNEAGELVDGQHRLAAIVEANVTIELLVAYNVPEGSQETVDTGTKRTYSDVLKLRGVGDSPTLASVVRTVTAYKKNVVPGGDNVPMTIPQYDRTLDQHPELYEIAKQAKYSYVHSGRLVPVSILGLCMWAFSHLEDAEDDAAFFFARLGDGQNLGEGHPIYAARKKLIELRGSPFRPHPTLLYGIIVKAWNFYREGREVSYIQFKIGGANPERIPVPK